MNKMQKAYRMYVQFKCDTAEYRNLAADLGYKTGELNKVFHARING